MLRQSQHEITIATAEPFVTDWVDELGGLLKRDLRRVVANPQDIKRYLGEFYNLARSMKRAGETSKGELTLRNFEQLVELGKAGNLDASDIGVANVKFLKNAKTIDSWNKTGFINSKVDYGIGKTAFLLRFVLAHEGLHTTIVGTSKPEHLAANVAVAGQGPLAADLVDEAKRRIRAALGSRKEDEG